MVLTIKKRPLQIGLTGGIGSGKTTAAHFFSELGTPIIDADQIAHKITQQNHSVLQSIVNHFGHSILQKDNTLNRNKLRNIIFHNVGEKKWLESLLHPLIRQEMRTQIHQINTVYCICVIPLLTESSGIDFIDRVLLIETPLEKQLSRAAMRDHSDIPSIQAIISAQASCADRRKIAQDILVNDGSLQDLKNKVLALHQQYCKLAAQNKM